MRAKLGVAAMPAAVGDLLATRAAGHPFFTEELALALRETGVLEILPDKSCKLTCSEAELANLDLPTTVQGTIVSRVDRLPPQPQLALKVASAFGRRIGAAELAAVYPIEADLAGLSSHLAALVAADLLVPEPGPEPAWAFKHLITREVAYGLLPASQRSQIHGAIAGYLEATFAADLTPYLAALAHHWERAGQAAKALDYTLLAGEWALGGYAVKEAIRYFSAARDLAEQVGAVPDGLLVRLHYGLAQAFRFDSDLQPAIAGYQRSLRLAAGTRDAAVQAGARVGLGICHQIRGDLDEALADVSIGREIAEGAGLTDQVRRALLTEARVKYKLGHPLDALATLDALEAYVRREGADPAEAHGQGFRGYILVSTEIPGVDIRARLEMGQEALRRDVAARRRLGDRVGLNDSLNLLGNAQWLVGDFGDAIRSFEENFALASELGAANDLTCALLNLAIMGLECGRLEETSRWATTAHEQAARRHDLDYVAIATALVASAEAWRGGAAAATKHASAAIASLELVSPASRGPTSLSVLPYTAEAALLAGDMRAAYSQACVAWEIAEQTGIRDYEPRIRCVIGAAGRAVGEPREARVHLEAALELGLAMGSAPGAARALVGLAQLAERPAETLAIASRALALLGDRDLPLDTAAIRLACGEAHLRLGDAEAAHAEFAAAAAIARQSGSGHQLSVANAGLTSAEAAGVVR